MAKVVAKTKVKKKKWVEVVAPVIFNNRSLGESYVSEPETLVGRQISANMMNVTGEPRKQNINLNFQVREIKEGKAQTFTRGFEMNSGSLKRFVRRGREKIGDSFRVKTKDNLTIRIKPLAVTNGKTPNSVVTKMRLAIRKLVAEEFGKNNFSEMVQSILRYDFQKNVKTSLCKIYPVKNFEIRVLKLLDEDKIPEEKLAAKPEIKKLKKEEKTVEEKVEEPKEDKTKEEKKATKEEVKEEKKTAKKEEKTEINEEKKATKKATSKKDDKK